VGPSVGRKSSDKWDALAVLFDIDHDARTAECKICPPKRVEERDEEGETKVVFQPVVLKIGSSGGTTNLFAHLKKHQSVLSCLAQGSGLVVHVAGQQTLNVMTFQASEKTKKRTRAALANLVADSALPMTVADSRYLAEVVWEATGRAAPKEVIAKNIGNRVSLRSALIEDAQESLEALISTLRSTSTCTAPGIPARRTRPSKVCSPTSRPKPGKSSRSQRCLHLKEAWRRLRWEGNVLRTRRLRSQV